MSSLSSQEPTNLSYPEPVRSSPHINISLYCRLPQVCYTLYPHHQSCTLSLERCNICVRLQIQKLLITYFSFTHMLLHVSTYIRTALSHLFPKAVSFFLRLLVSHPYCEAESAVVSCILTLWISETKWRETNYSGISDSIHFPNLIESWFILKCNFVLLLSILNTWTLPNYRMIY